LIFDTWILPDVVETYVFPLLVAVGAMALKTGTRKYHVTSEQTGLETKSSFEFVDDQATCVALEPERLCLRILSSTTASKELKHLARDFARVTNLKTWIQDAVAIHRSEDLAVRLYP
jgi:hypothetical protein